MMKSFLDNRPTDPNRFTIGLKIRPGLLSPSPDLLYLRLLNVLNDCIDVVDGIENPLAQIPDF